MLVPGPFPPLPHIELSSFQLLTTDIVVVIIGAVGMWVIARLSRRQELYLYAEDEVEKLLSSDYYLDRQFEEIGWTARLSADSEV